MTAVSPLPANNGSTDGLIDRLTITTSKDLDPTTVVGTLGTNVTYFDGHYYLLTPTAMTWPTRKPTRKAWAGTW